MVRCADGEADSRRLPPSDEAAACTSRAIPGGRVLVCPGMVLVREVSDDDRSADDAGAPGGLLSERDHLRARARVARAGEKVGEKESDIKTRTTKGRYSRGDTIATGNPNHMRGEDA